MLYKDISKVYLFRKRAYSEELLNVHHTQEFLVYIFSRALFGHFLALLIIAFVVLTFGFLRFLALRVGVKDSLLATSQIS